MKTLLVLATLALSVHVQSLSAAASPEANCGRVSAGEFGLLADSPKTTHKNVGVEDFDQLRKEKSNVVLDVRTPREFAAGHIPGAVNIDVNASDFEAKMKALDPKKTYLVHCASGGRSVKACQKLNGWQFDNLVNLEGGYKAWEKAGKPVTK
jgi:rhodanese-related sulfurtransferase